jgi:hypothetical protein
VALPLYYYQSPGNKRNDLGLFGDGLRDALDPRLK